MKLFIRTLMVGIGAWLLGACASSLAAVEGPLEINKAYTITLERPWNRYSDGADTYWTRGDRLTQDGEALNAIRLIGALKPGDYIVRPQRKEFPTPIYKVDMTESELAEFLTDSISALGYEQVAASELRPHAFGSLDGIAMDLVATSGRGLRLKGEARLARSGDTLNAMLFLAPELHYHDAYKAEVSRMFDSARTK